MPIIRRILGSPVTCIVIYLALYAGLNAAAAACFFAVYHGNPQTRTIGILGEGFASLTAIFTFWVMTRFADKRPWSSRGFVLRGFVSETLAGYMIGMALLSGVIGLMATVGVYQFVGTNPRFMIALPLLAFLLVAINEETLFRGYFFQTLEARWGTGIALTVTSLFFGLAHLVNPVAGITLGEKLFSALCIVFEAGILLGAAYVATRRMWLPIGIHWAWNFFEGPFYGTHVSGETLGSSYIVSRTSGAFLLTGGVFGPEGSIICLTVSTIAGLLLLRLAVKNGQWRSGNADTVTVTVPAATLIDAEPGNLS